MTPDLEPVAPEQEDIVATDVVAEAAPRRGLMRLVPLALSVFVLAGVGYIAVGAVGSSGGSGSPEAAVRKLAERVADEDIIGALDTIAPDEVRVFKPMYEQNLDAARDRDALEPGESPLQGIDVQIDGLALRTEQLGEDVAKVVVEDGTFALSVDPEKVIAPLRAMAADGGAPIDESITVAEIRDELTSDGSISGVFVMTVKRDGAWYVSPSYTLAQYLTEAAGRPTPDFDRRRGSVGEDSPEAAVERMVRAGAAFDVDQVLDRLAPDELPVLSDYRDVLLDRDARAEIAATARETQVTFDVLELDATDGPDGYTRVELVRAEGSVRTPDGTTRFAIDGLCVETHDGDDPCDDPDALRMLRAAVGGDRYYVLVKEVDGRWYPSVLRTAVEYGNGFSRGGLPFGPTGLLMAPGMAPDPIEPEQFEFETEFDGPLSPPPDLYDTATTAPGEPAVVTVEELRERGAPAPGRAIP